MISNDDSDFKFVWVIENPNKATVQIKGLLSGGSYFVKGETKVNLHEQFSYEKLRECQGLKDAERHGHIRTIDKRIVSQGILGEAPSDKSQRDQELEDIRNQFGELKELLLQKNALSPGSNQENLKNEIDELKQMLLTTKESASSSSLPADYTTQFEDIRNLLNQHPPTDNNDDLREQINEIKALLQDQNQQKMTVSSVSPAPEFDLVSLSEKIAEAVNIQVNERLAAIGAGQPGTITLDGYKEKAPEDVITDDIVRQKDKISGKGTLEQKSALKEQAIEINIDDQADLLANL